VEEVEEKRKNMTKGEENKEVKNWAQREKKSRGKLKERKEAIKVQEEDKISYYFMSPQSLLVPFFLFQPRFEDFEREDRRFQFET
jgi:hypothetical protein